MEEKTYIVFKDAIGCPYEILVFRGYVSTGDVQRDISELAKQFKESHSECDEIFMEDWVLNKLHDRYHFDTLYWSNDDVVSCY